MENDREHKREEDPVRVSEGLGGATGAAAGTGLGALLGPAGMIVGGLAGAVGGWWAGREVGRAAGDFGDDSDTHYRRLHDERHAEVPYDDARHFYRLGHLARRNPAYRDRSFAEIEPELRAGWSGQAGRFQTWDDVRPFVQGGYDDAPS
jgi:hypothetical protein